jgi:hypothetical protein
VIRELVFCFGVALFDPWLPEVHDGVPVIAIERLFRFRQQFLAKAVLHESILLGLVTKVEDDNARLVDLRSRLKVIALSQDLLQQFGTIFGLHPGFRPAHAKGAMLTEGLRHRRPQPPSPGRLT